MLNRKIPQLHARIIKKHIIVLAWSVLIVLSGCNSLPISREPSSRTSSSATQNILTKSRAKTQDSQEQEKTSEADAKSVKTRFGTLTTRQDSRGHQSIILDGKILMSDKRGSLNLGNTVYSFPDYDVVLVIETIGGNDLVFLMTALILYPDQKLKVLEHREFFSTDENIWGMIKQTSTLLEIDLGFEKGLRRVARIEGDTLKITKEKPQTIEPVPDDFCDRLYTYELKTSCGNRIGVRNCTDETRRLLNGEGTNVSRGYMLSAQDYPAFNAKKYGQYCTTACRTNKFPDISTFKREVCGYTKSSGM